MKKRREKGGMIVVVGDRSVVCVVCAFVLEEMGCPVKIVMYNLVETQN